MHLLAFLCVQREFKRRSWSRTIGPEDLNVDETSIARGASMMLWIFFAIAQRTGVRLEPSAWLPAARDEQHTSFETAAQTETTAPAEIARVPKAASMSNRHAKLHVGGYFDPSDPTLVAFQKLKVDLRRSQQDMLLEALRDFVAKQEAASAFR